MKLCKLNIHKDNSTFNPFESDDHFEARRTTLVADDYDFNDNGDTDASSDVLEWEKHYKRLGINYIHFLKTIQGVILPKYYTNFPTLDVTDFDALSDNEKSAGVKYHTVQYTDRVISGYVSDSIDILNWDNVLANSKNGRIQLIEQLRVVIGEDIRIGLITLENTQAMFREVHHMVSYYKQSNDPEFKVWLCSLDDTIKSGYNHSADGFNTKAYWFQDLEDRIMAIYNGTHYI